MEPFFDFVGHFWWLIFPLSGLFGGWARSWSRASERRHRRRVELYKLRNQAAKSEQASQSQVRQLMDSHDAVNRRWLDYELDVGKLIDFPVMTDVREPLTVAFLRAKRQADGLRPGAPGDITTASRLAEYREAVNGYELAFDVAEREARRTVEKEGLRKLLELLREPRYRVVTTWDLDPKCGKCDENRKLRYTTPRGNEAFETCECATTTTRWITEEMLVHEVAKRSGKILAWYHPASRYFDDDSIASPNVLKSPDGVTLEEMAKNPRDYGFATEADAQILAGALNEASA